MSITYTLPQNKVEQQNMYTFQNAISSFRLEVAKETVKASEGTDVKALTLDIVSSAQKLDIKTKNTLADMIEAWSINLNSLAWIDEVKRFCVQKADISNVYSVLFLEKRQIIIVVDDMTSESVLDYNLFSFELRNKYNDIKDFMVIDDESYCKVKDEFVVCDEVYKRG